MLYCYDEKTCLNGWWDIQFDGEAHGAAYLVPSPWTKSSRAIRKPDQTYFDHQPHDGSDQNDYQFDCFGYPAAWSLHDAAVVGRELTLSPQAGRRYLLVLEAVAHRCQLSLNGKLVASHQDPALPFVADVTEFLIKGTNRLQLAIQGPELPEPRKSLYPVGNSMLFDFRGIWQDVYLVERPEVYIESVHINTSVRSKTLSLKYTLRNASSHHQTVELEPRVEGTDTPRWEHRAVTVAAQSTAVVNFEAAWPHPRLWCPADPHLYFLKTRLNDETFTERFGFREVWLDGVDLVLNGHPIHLFSDWGHKMTSFHHTQAWVNQWFAMIKDGNMNHSRLHTHPHPRFILDLADEQGILITGETSIHGSGGNQAADHPEFWQNARDHVAAFIERDRNHPCVISWSAENEMRWNRDKTPLSKQELPKIRQLFDKLDPSRPVCHEGDSSWWNEAELPMLSRHYGKECTGLGWWDKKVPLHSGELALYHYAGPNNTQHRAGESAWTDYRNIDRAAAEDLAFTVEDARANDVICLGPWNMSCLSNLRPFSEVVRLSYPDYTTPGVKPLLVQPGASEFEFWKPGKGYYPQASFGIQAHAFRPLAIIDTNRQNQHVTGVKVERTLHLINDTPADVNGILIVRCGVFQHRQTIALGQGRRLEVPFQWIPQQCGKIDYTVELNGQVELKRTLNIAAPQAFTTVGKIGLWGQGSLKRHLPQAESISTVSNAYATIIVQKNQVEADPALKEQFHQYVLQGGRLLLLEQSTSLFPSLKIKAQPVQKAFLRHAQSPVLKGLTEDDLEFWGPGAFSHLSGDSAVAEFLYEKGTGESAFPLVDAGEGGFGYGDLDGNVVWESPEGQGLVVACQLRLSDKLDSIPAARTIFQNLLDYLAAWKPSSRPVLVTDSLKDALAFEGPVVLPASDEVLAHFGLKPVVDPAGIYQGIHQGTIPHLSQEDLCGIEAFTYSPADSQDFTVATRAFEGDLEPLVLTPTHSALRELFIQKGLREPLRAHTVTQHCYLANVQPSVLVGRKGRFVISAFDAQGRTRFSRLVPYLVRALGGLPASRLWQGDYVSLEAQRGYPLQVHKALQAPTPEVQKRMVETTSYQIERMNPTAILDLTAFELIPTDQGILTATKAGRQCLFYTVESPTVRKDLGSNLGVPNPDALTFLELKGTGRVEFWLNARLIGTSELGGSYTFSDLELERGYNHVLLFWEASQTGATLGTLWRTIGRKPETSLKFIAQPYKGN